MIEERVFPKEGSRDTKRGLIVSLYPDYCRVPGGICPFIVHAFQGEDANTAPTVRLTGERAHTSGSFIIRCHGDEGGTGLGIRSGTQMGRCEPRTWSGTVRIEGKPAVRHSDEWYMNNRNTIGRLNWTEDTGFYDPTPPFAGEEETAAFRAPAQAVSGPGVLVADAGGVIGYAGSLAAPSVRVTGGFAGTARPFPVLPSMPSIPSGVFSRYAPRIGLGALLMVLFERLDANVRDKIQDNFRKQALADRLLAPVRRGDVTIAGFDVDAGFLVPKIEKANRLLTHMNGGQLMTVDDITADEVDAILAGWKVRDRTREEDAERSGVKALSYAMTLDNVRITSRCRTIEICFMPREGSIDMVEFYRQLKLQQAGLNRLSPVEYEFNRAVYRYDPVAVREAAKPFQQKTRLKYEKIRKKELQRLYPQTWWIALAGHMSTVDALHNPDMVAGGYITSVADESLPIEDRIGGKSENRSIGRQWSSRVYRLDLHAARQIMNRCPFLGAILEICVSMPGSPGEPVSEQAEVP